jgi:NADH:ubiquinone oxidoreductase subunit D
MLLRHLRFTPIPEDVFDYTLRSEMRQACIATRLERIRAGVWTRQPVTPPPKDKVYTEMEALIQHFLIYSQGFNVPAGGPTTGRGPRGGMGSTSSRTAQPPVAQAVRRRRFSPSGPPKVLVGRMIAGVIA